MVVLLSSCGATMNVDWRKEGFKGVEFGTVAVIATGKDRALRTVVEEDISKLIQKKGIQTKLGTELFTPVNSLRNLEVTEIATALKEANIDGVITVTLLDVKERSNYTSGKIVSYPDGYVRVGKYIYRNYSRVVLPGYYTNVNDYLIESNLYDLKASNKKEALLWSGQSDVYDPKSLESAASSYASNLVRYLFDNNLIITEK
jgi:hypothetical protein